MCVHVCVCVCVQVHVYAGVDVCALQTCVCFEGVCVYRDVKLHQTNYPGIYSKFGTHCVSEHIRGAPLKVWTCSELIRLKHHHKPKGTTPS